jgi:glycerol-3-phosphate acyltransferase PlsY
MLLRILITALVCYFLGNHNGAICVSAMLHDDVRTHGSGNAGLTNFIRNYGAGRSVLVILIDVFKAVLACLLAGLVFEPYDLALEGTVLGGACVMLGHDFPALQGFRGGKGILSGWVVAWMIDWRIGAMIAVVFFSAYLITRYVSLGSVLAAATFGAGFVIFHHNNLPVMLGGLFMSILTIFMHRSNILRLIRGEERKTNLLGKGKQK